jgi:hypothetical protein
MSRFYLTLPSNASMEVYPNNTAAQFQTKLSSKMELEGEWEAGLVEISCPNEFFNVDKNQCSFVLCGDSIDSARVYKVEADYYRSIDDLLDAINNFTSPQGITLTFMDNGRNGVRSRIKLTNESDWIIKFNDDLAMKIGFSPYNQYGSGIHFSRADYDLNYQETSTMYVYCDLLEHVVVGDTKAPLIRMINVKRNSNGGNMHCVMNPPIYVPLQKKHFDTIEINIMTDAGQTVPFKDGKSVVVMEFRRTLPTIL